MGDREKASLRLQFNPQIRLELHGATITSDAGLLAFRELDDALDLTPIASDYLQESRTGRNIRHHLVPLLRQSIYSRLAGYDDTNDAERLSQDPAMRVVVGWQGSDRNAARTNTMSRFETETLTQEDNLADIPQIEPPFLDIAPAGMLPTIISHSKGVKCVLIRSNSSFHGPTTVLPSVKSPNRLSTTKSLPWEALLPCTTR